MTRANQRHPFNTTSRNLRAAGIGVVILAICVAFFAGVYPRGAGAQTGPSLRDAASFAVLAGSTVTNTGTPTIVYGNLGVSPGSAVTGFPPGVVNGVTHPNTAVAQDAQGGVTAAFGVLDQPCTEDLTGQNLGGLTLTSGVYCYDTSAGMTGTLTLDGQGNTDAVFIIKTGSTLITASASSVNLINGANACNVFWRVGSSATLGTTTSFAGNILAQASITLDSGATVIGRTLARDGAVTMDNNIVDARTCTAEASTVTPPPSTATPPPSTATLPPATATAVAVATSTAVAAATSTAVVDATSTAIAVASLPPATATAAAVATSTAVAAATSTAVVDATSTAIAVASLPPATATAAAVATSTAVAATSTAMAENTSTPTSDDTSTPTGDSTGTPTGDSTGTPTSVADTTGTPAVGTGTPSSSRTSTPTLSAPGAPGTGSGPGSGGSTSTSLLTAGVALLLIGGSAAVALASRRRA